MRGLVLAKSRFVLQDDTGIPWRYYKKDKATWQAAFFGRYTKPIAIFHYNRQVDLAAAYADSLHRPGLLPFYLGYGLKKESNLQLFRKQEMVKN